MPGEDLPEALMRWADPGYFSALGIPLVSGRFFTSDERVARSYKVIVSRELVRQYLRRRKSHRKAPARSGACPCMERPTKSIMKSWAWSATRCTRSAKSRRRRCTSRSLRDLTVRCSLFTLRRSRCSFQCRCKNSLRRLDPGLPVSDVRTMDQLIGESLVNASLSATLVLAFAVLSLLLASVGLYGVLSYLTTQRTPELGIRMALGAQRDQLLQLMLIDGLRPALFGLGLGLVMSIAATRMFQSMLFGTKPLDPAVLFGVIATLLAVAVLACLAPAWRASRLDPMQALRTE